MTLKEFTPKGDKNTCPANILFMGKFEGKLLKERGAPAPIMFGLRIFYMCLAGGREGISTIGFCESIMGFWVLS